MTSSHRLKVGIDFGTTYSGVSWAHEANPKEVVIIREWPGGTRTSDKVPTEISYKSTGEVHKWGFEIKPSMARLMWFKLLLDPAKYPLLNQSPTIIRTKKLIPASKKPVDVVTDYLSCLKKHTLEKLERAYGKTFMDVTPIDYCLTVPAVGGSRHLIWSDAAKALTMQAAERAGFGNKSAIRLISEPDAAAAWSLLQDLHPNSLKAKDTFVVVDCGGGTVDLISYTVVSVEPTLTVKECAVGSGGLCGSTFLNQAFEELVKSRIGKRLDRMSEGPRSMMLKFFDENLKRSFSGSDDDDIFSCPIPGVEDDPDAGIEEGCLILTKEDMLKIFDPVIKQILELVHKQIAAVESPGSNKGKVSNILLVGGFGACEYLLNRLETDMKTRKKKKPQIEILQPINAWSSIARGAVLHGLGGNINVSSRKARRHYGTAYSRTFNDEEDPDEHLVYNAYTGRRMCNNLMDYYVNLGDQVSEDTPIIFHFVRNVGLRESMIFTEELFECEETDAAVYSTSPSVKSLCTFDSDLTSVPKSMFIRRERPGSPSYYEIHYELVMTIQSAMIIFHSQFQGKQYGNGTAKYLYE